MPPLRRATAIYPDGNLDVHPVSARAQQVSSSTRPLVPVVPTRRGRAGPRQKRKWCQFEKTLTEDTYGHTARSATANAAGHLALVRTPTLYEKLEHNRG